MDRPPSSPLPARSPLIEALFEPVEVRAFAAPASADLIDELHADERAALGPMSEGRRAEFATARACARRALAAFDVRGPVLRSDAGEPRWPDGARGSISHTKGFCAAVATVDDRSVGLDVEEVDRMSAGVERRVLIDAERLVLAGLGGDARHRFVATVFAAKEAFYKAHFALDPRYLGFDAVHVSVDGSDVVFGPSNGAVDSQLLGRTTGRRVFEDGRVLVGVAIGP